MDKFSRATGLKDETFMQRCFDLALNGAGSVAPNPMVGAVIVHDSRVIGEGFHERLGGPHAEVNAIAAVDKGDQDFLRHSTLYVNLEPCCHYGKTPPCSDLIIRSGIKRVVIANRDPNPLVAGKGIRQLKKAGVIVTEGVLKKDGAWINRRFFTFHTKKRPYIILKWAQSTDGYFTKDASRQHWITNDTSRRLAHRWRSEEAAILAGFNTVKTDNPQLTNRLWMKGRQPTRVIVDRRLQLPRHFHVFDSSAATIVFSERPSRDSAHIRFVQMKSRKAPPRIVARTLFDAGINSLIVEGGAKLLDAFITANLWDEARIFTGDVMFGKGVPAPVINGRSIAEETIVTDRLQIFANPDQS